MNPKANGAEDKDRLFLEEVLDKLYDFGDGPKKKLKSQKKKKRKRSEEEEDEDASAKDVCSDSEDSRTECLGVAQKQQTSKMDNSKAIHTAVQQSQVQVQVVTFQDPTKKPKTKQTSAPDQMSTQKTKEKKQTDQPEELSLEKARLEVHRFGITGYKKEQQRVFEQDRAVMLGARPPKKDYVNYKVLQEQIKEKKQKAKEEVQPDLKKKKKQNNPRDKKKKVAASGSGSAVSGQVGRFKNGMLILSSKEIQKIKASRGSKQV